MKKLTLIIVSLFISCNFVYAENAVKDGIFKTYHKNGEIFTETQYLKGVKDGRQKTYNEDGSLRNEFFYEKGIQKQSRTYYPTGELWLEVNYYKDGRTKKETFYYKDKIIKGEYFYNPKGKLAGTINTYHPNGQMKYVDFYKSGKLKVRRAFNEEGMEINYFIPRNLEESLEHLDEIMDDPEITTEWRLSYALTNRSWEDYNKEISEEELKKNIDLVTHSIQTAWVLEGKSHLATYFNNLGIHSSEKMAEIILLAYHRKVNGKEINLDGLLKN